MAELVARVDQPRISIALCTCNGASFLAEQLDSLLEQTYLPFELVACDDASQDESFAILETFATRAPFQVRIYRNQQRLGINANFEQAIRMCEGNIIALCDQDDVWQPNKLALFADSFTTGKGWICCNAEVCDRNLHSLGYTLWHRVNFKRTERKLAREGRLFDVLIKHFVVAGASLAFKAQARDRLLPIPRDWLYDAWLSAVLAATENVGIKETPLQHYRQHNDNALGAMRKSLRQDMQAALSLDRQTYYEMEIRRWDELAARLRKLEVKEIFSRRVDAKIAHLRRRATLPFNRLARLSTVAAELLNGGYIRYNRNLGSIALDLLVK